MRLGLRRRHLLVFDLCILSAAGVLLLIWPMAWLPIVILVGMTMVASWMLSRMSARYFHRALSRLRVAADAIGRGDLSRSVDVTTGEEHTTLVRWLNQLAERQATTEIEHARLLEESDKQ